MGQIVRKTFSANEKAMVALEALKGNMTLNEITKRYGVHSTQINNWKKRLKEGIIEIFSQGRQKRDLETNELVDALYKKIGQLEVELDWVKKNLNCSISEKRQLIEPYNAKLTIARQCDLLGLSRSGYYYQPQSINETQLALLKIIDKVYTEYPVLRYHYK